LPLRDTDARIRALVSFSLISVIPFLIYITVPKGLDTSAGAADYNPLSSRLPVVGEPPDRILTDEISGEKYPQHAKRGLGIMIVAEYLCLAMD
jgi:hypothetical protein